LADSCSIYEGSVDLHDTSHESGLDNLL